MTEINNDEIDLGLLALKLFEGKWQILTWLVLGLLLAWAYVWRVAPVYQVNASIVVEDRAPQLPGLEAFYALENRGNTGTYKDIILSRSVLAPVVAKHQLNVQVMPHYLPVIGRAFARHASQRTTHVVAPPVSWLAAFAWGGEEIEISTFTALSDQAYAQTYTLVIDSDDSFSVYIDETVFLGRGTAGTRHRFGAIEMAVNHWRARPGTAFTVVLEREISAIERLAQQIVVNQSGRGSSASEVLALTLNHQDAELAKQIVNDVLDTFVKFNIDRTSLDLQKSLEFLYHQLPKIKAGLIETEEQYNRYQESNQSIDLSSETTTLLQRITAIEEKIFALKLEQSVISRQYTVAHPKYKIVTTQIETLLQEKNSLSEQISHLPDTIQDTLRIKRELAFKEDVYKNMLDSIREVEVAKAGVVGNVSILDRADVNLTQPVAPKANLILVVGGLLGAMLGVLFLLITHALKRTVNTMDTVEQKIGLTTLALVPYSKNQFKLAKTQTLKIYDDKPRILAEAYGNDTAVESLRNVVPALHFALSNTVEKSAILITGATPNIGKSFVSVNLAVILAATTQKVLLIDADLRRGKLERYFFDNAINNTAPGLIDLLTEQAARELVVRAHNEYLDVIMRGHTRDDKHESSALLSQNNFSDLVRWGLTHYDHVIIDSAPVLAVADASMIAQKNPVQVVALAKWDETSVDELVATKKVLNGAGVSIAGVIINGIRAKSNRFGQAYYGYYQYDAYHTKVGQ